MKCWHIVLLFLAVLTLSACGTSNNFAPVSNGWDNATAASQTYRVQPDDTLYSIAFRYGLDYRQLADLNHVTPPAYHISPGQTLQLLPEADDTLTTSAAPQGNTAPATTTTTTAPGTTATSSVSTPTTPVTTNVSPPAPPAVAPTGPVTKWLWPAQGQVIHTFSNAYGGNKGIDITGPVGTPIRATAAGRVVYCGTGLRGYGLLIIIKHNSEYLSAYAHNSKAFVKEGDIVAAGQTIAAMGSTDAPQVMLHFEIRQAGKPIDPLGYLPARQG